MDKQVQGGFARDIAMDLGTTSVLVAVRGRGILLQEPSVVAVDRRTGAVLVPGAFLLLARAGRCHPGF